MAESLACVDHSAFGCGYGRLGFRALGLRVWGRICSMRPSRRGVLETRRQQFVGIATATANFCISRQFEGL